MIVFGPLFSRRLGRSLGVNHLPSKHCTYSCGYCQAGRTPRTELKRAAFHEPEEVIAAVRARVQECRAAGEAIDYISFVPDGEPTLDENLGRHIRGLRPLGIPVAVLTNGSMLWREDVRSDLASADLVSVEIDTLRELPWRMLDRPNPRLDLSTIIEGIRTFARDFAGVLYTQTMLVDGVNDDPATIEEVAAFIAGLRPKRAFLAVPTRPPADQRIRPPSEAALQRAFAILSARVPGAGILIENASGTLAGGADRIANLLATLAVHPMSRDAVEHYLGGADALETLVAAGRLRCVDYEAETFVAG